MNQWKNTNDVINWYICDFYPSITNTLLQKVLKFASKYSTISKEDIDIIKNTKKTTLYKDGQPLEKITSKFDVTIGSYDGAEICELVGLYLLSQMQDLNINMGLYRDDGLAITRQTPREVEMMKKKLCKIFRENELRITVETNKTVVDFLDITLNLRTVAYKQYKNPNDIINYINCESNHPPSIIQNLPKGIGTRLSTNSSSNEIFQEAAKPYNDALKQNGYKQLLIYSKNENLEDRREKTIRKSAQENTSPPKNIKK